MHARDEHAQSSEQSRVGAMQRPRSVVQTNDTHSTHRDPRSFHIYQRQLNWLRSLSVRAIVLLCYLSNIIQ